ncbi:MAG: ribosomal RNA small subunit methyltransferase A [Bacteriovoracaceae bacterium]|nr:ribosomal RNA small subunit methyltransferase A [Bacteriovoracaceae bacterium]
MKKVYAKKKLGQHFLVNKQVAREIADDWARESSAIIEVGPGKGVLTDLLIEWNIPTHAIEKDERMRDILLDILEENQITFGDALKIDLEKLVDDLSWNDEKIWLVSNLPYNISVPLMMKFTRVENIKYMTLMFQKEVGEKIVPNSNKKNIMNSLMAICCNYFDCKQLCKVHPGSFAPPPEVESVVISFKRWDHPTIPLREFDSYEQFLRRLFAFKRKQIGTILKRTYEKSRLLDALNECGISTTDRAESLDLLTIQTLYQKLKRNVKMNS